MAATGQFVYYKTAKGYYNYRLKASNKTTIAVSGGKGYSSLSACTGGITSVRNNVGSKIEDQTLQNAEKLTYPKYEIYQDKEGKFRFRLFARNGELICTCEDGYASKETCKKGIQSLQKWAVTAVVVSEDDED